MWSNVPMDHLEIIGNGKVVATMPVEQQKASSATRRSLYKAVADSMVYQESSRTVTYRGKPAVLTTPEAETHAPTVVLKLDEEGRKLERMDATSDPADSRPEQVTATLTGGDIERCQQYLKVLKVGFSERTAAKAAGGKPARAEIAVTGSLPCEIDMRADYAGHRVALELTNVRRLGRVVYRLAPGTFTEAVNDLARFVLGADDDFETVARAG